MKLIVGVIIILTVVVIALAGTSGPEKCPLCGKPYNEGSVKVYKVIKGVDQLVHLNCVWTEVQAQVYKEFQAKK